MIFLGMVGGFGGAPKWRGAIDLLKPGGGSMTAFDPLKNITPGQLQLLRAKIGLINGARSPKLFESSANLKQLAYHILALQQQLFPGIGALIVARRNDDYATIAQTALPFQPAELQLSAPNSIVRAAGETNPSLYRRTIYIPDLGSDVIFTASEFDTVGGGNALLPDHHELEEGMISASGLHFETFSLKRQSIASLAVAPMLEFKREDPSGAILLFGGKDFLDPLVDLIVLRLLADYAARPLKNIPA